MASACSRVAPPTPPSSYLFLWAGDAEGKASDFLGVIDADPRSAHYGAIVASLPTGMAGTHPHHTEHEMPAGSHLLANGFHAGRTWLFDLTQPLHPRIAATFGDLAGFSHPHTYIRTPDGHVLATFQYAAGQRRAARAWRGAAVAARTTGGLVEMNERGQVVKRGGARDASIADSQIFPYSVLPMPAIDRAVSTTTDMDEKNTEATSEWLQFWRLSDLTLLRSLALEPGPRGDEHKLTGELRLLPDGQSVYIHTFSCGLYLLRGVDQLNRASASSIVRREGLRRPGAHRHYWLQPVPARTRSSHWTSPTLSTARSLQRHTRRRRGAALDRDRSQRPSHRLEFGRVREEQPAVRHQLRPQDGQARDRRHVSRRRQHASGNRSDRQDVAAWLHGEGPAARNGLLAMSGRNQGCNASVKVRAADRISTAAEGKSRRLRVTHPRQGADHYGDQGDG